MEKFHCGSLDWSVYAKGVGMPLVFLHAFPLDHTMYSLACLPLEDAYRVILPDLPGFGEARFLGACVPERVTMSEYADGLALLLDELGEEKVVLCGVSMGGYIAMQFFRRHAQRLAGLIFCDTRSTPDLPTAAKNRLILADTIHEHGSASLCDRMVPNLLSPETTTEQPDVVDFLREMISRQDPNGIAAAARGMAARDDSTEYLKDILVPTLVLGGVEDMISPPEAMRELASRIPGSEFSVIPSAGHLPPLESPVLFASTVRAFVDKAYDKPSV